MTAKLPALWLMLAGCATSLKAVKGPEVPPEAADTLKPTPNLPPIPAHQPAAPAALALARGWMPLASTGVPLFRAEHPLWDGRGVLIAILDSGVDPGTAGLDSTTTGRPKLLDLRNFSGEGRLALSPVAAQGDTIAFGGRRWTGASRVRATAAGGSWYAGLLTERSLGDAPAADLNENGSDSDSLLVVVARASDGWVLFADSDGDGSLADERPVHDYLVARETFGWHRAGALPPAQIAVNFTPASAERPPDLDLVFDTDAHGTHVAGIAAGHAIGGVAGFDGVAPGAQLLGLKIARNDLGGITTTGSVVAALEYAIRFAGAHRMPLVVNMSFGVGNEREGAARLDALLDSLLLAHPEVVFVTSAGNDGPGLSTMGFPGSLRRGITVGATQAPAFFGGSRSAPEPLLFFSSRGGELAKPDLVAPGTAYSTVPRWNEGDEFKSGTSMASPHVAGLAALLLSAALAQHREVTSADVRRALRGSARPIPGEGILDAGAGEPDLTAAWRILESPAPPVEYDVEVAGRPGTTAAFTVAPADSLIRFVLRRVRGNAAVQVTLTSDVPWLLAPARLALDAAEQQVTLRQRSPGESPGTYGGTVRAELSGVSGALFQLVSTVMVPDALRPMPLRVTAKLAPGGQRRVLFAADSGRPFRVRIASRSAGEPLTAALHQPGGAPILGDNGLPAGMDSTAAVYDVDGSDARAGLYQAVAVAPPGASASAQVSIDPAPVGLRVTAGPGDTVALGVLPLADSALAGRVRAGALGGIAHLPVAGVGGAEVRVPLRLPAWVRHVVADLELDPAQWPRFTDFGFALVDGSGRVLEKEPANYAVTRLTATIPAREPGDSVHFLLAPGFAEPGSREPWSGRLTLRLEADHPVVLPAREGDEFNLSGNAPAWFHASAGGLPWALPEGYAPLVLILVESGGLVWTWERSLAPLAARRP